MQHADDFPMFNTHYKDHGGYAINIRSFDIVWSLGKPHTMKDENKLLQIIGLKKVQMRKIITHLQKPKKGTSPATDETKVSTIITGTLPLTDEKLINIIFKHYDTIPPEVLQSFTNKNNSILKRERRKISVSRKKGDTF